MAALGKRKTCAWRDWYGHNASHGLSTPLIIECSIYIICQWGLNGSDPLGYSTGFHLSPSTMHCNCTIIVHVGMNKRLLIVLLPESSSNLR